MQCCRWSDYVWLLVDFSTFEAFSTLMTVIVEFFIMSDHFRDKVQNVVSREIQGCRIHRINCRFCTPSCNRFGFCCSKSKCCLWHVGKAARTSDAAVSSACGSPRAKGAAQQRRQTKQSPKQAAAPTPRMRRNFHDNWSNGWLNDDEPLNKLSN